MPGGVSNELAALHARRLQAENEMRERLYGWVLENCHDQTIGSVRLLAEELRNVIGRAVQDAYNLPRPGDAQTTT